MLPWSFSEEAAVEKYMAQLQHNMWVIQSRLSVLSIITGGGKWVEMSIPVDPLYLSVLVSGEKKFCVQSGETPHLVPAPAHRGRSHGGYELVQQLAGICRAVSPDAARQASCHSVEAQARRRHIPPRASELRPCTGGTLFENTGPM